MVWNKEFCLQVNWLTFYMMEQRLKDFFCKVGSNFSRKDSSQIFQHKGVHHPALENLVDKHSLVLFIKEIFRQNLL